MMKRREKNKRDGFAKGKFCQVSRLLTLALALMLFAAACGREEEPVETEPEEELSESFVSPEVETKEPEEAKVFGVTYEDKSWQEKDEDGTVLLNITLNLPRVSLPEAPEAEEAINAFWAEQEEAFRVTALEYKKWAGEDLAFRKSEEQAAAESAETEETGIWTWTPYEMGRQYSEGRQDEIILSFVQNDYEYTGGAHPNSVRAALNFDSRSGARLKLADVVTDMDETTEFVNLYLVEALPETIGEEGLFDDYKTSIFDILTDDTWYLNEEGFVIICNEYIVSPHSSGINEITIPYEEADFLKEEYK